MAGDYCFLWINTLTKELSVIKAAGYSAGLRSFSNRCKIDLDDHIILYRLFAPYKHVSASLYRYPQGLAPWDHDLIRHPLTPVLSGYEMIIKIWNFETVNNNNLLSSVHSTIQLRFIFTPDLIIDVSWKEDSVKKITLRNSNQLHFITVLGLN